MTGPRIEDRVRVVGHRWSPRVHEIKSWLARSRVPYLWLDVEEDDEAAEMLARLGRRAGDRAPLPLVALPEGDVLEQPTLEQLAGRLGMATQAESQFYDLVIVGGGPTGLSAAVYAASEGLTTVVIEASAPGGQAGHSAAIENYLGFPEGLSGNDLARRAVVQAERFGVEIVAPRAAVELRADGDYRCVRLDDGAELSCHAVLLANGLAFKWLDVPGCPRLVGAGVYYGAATAEATEFAGREVYLLGAGNSAGQAALLLAEHASRVHVVFPEASIDETMSSYLADQLRELENVALYPHTVVVGASGERNLEQLTLQCVDGGTTRQVPASGLFVFIGATPRTDWLRGVLRTDEQGFVLTGRRAMGRRGEQGPEWPERRDPHLLETSLPGVFAAGDVRHGSVKRLASAIGEGAMAVQFIHEFRKGR